MCKLKSGIILKDRVFVPEYDSHSAMLEELHIADTRKNAEGLFVRAELYPRDGDLFSPIDTWVYNVDQDILPDWYVEDFDKSRFLGAVKAWSGEHIHIGKTNFSLSAGTHYLKNCSQVTAWENSKVTARENSQVTAWWNSQVTAWENSKVTARENSQVTAWGNSQVAARENSQVTAWGNSQVTARENSQVTARENSQVTARGNSQVTARGNSQVTARENSQVTAWGNSQVTAWGNSQVTIPVYSINRNNNIILMQKSTLVNHNTRTIYHCGDWKLVEIDEGKVGNKK